MIWNLESWQHPCYNINNGRCKSILKWKNVKKILYEEQTNNIIPILSFKRPHSRALHLSIILILFTFFVKFHLSVFNLLQDCHYNNTVTTTPNNTLIVILDSDITYIRYNAIYALCGASIFRVLFGYIADRFGVRISFCILILLSTIIGILNINYNFIILKILNGISSAGFILSELWVITMFDINILGLTTGIIGGIGNFGIGLLMIINYTIINNIKINYLQYVIYWPYIIFMLFIYPIYYHSDDSPFGNYLELKKIYLENIVQRTPDNNLDNTSYSDYTQNTYSLDNDININNIIQDISFSKKNIYNALKSIKLLSISLAYLYSFGLELTLFTNFLIILRNNINISLYNSINLLLIYSSINLLGRPIGGYISDKNYEKFKIIGKIKLMQLFTIFTIMFGIIFTNIISNDTDNNNLFNNLLFSLCFLSFSNNLLQGTIIGIIPHMDSANIGVLLGVISSFGTIGGIIGNILFINYDIYTAFTYINYFGIITFISNTFILL